MADISDLRKNIKEEEVRYRSAVSESTFFKMGGAINFINNKQHSEKQFFANGKVWTAPMPQTGVDGLLPFNFNAEIINVWAYVYVAGSGSYVEYDLKYCTAPGGSFTSVFSTTPKIYASTGSDQYVDSNGVITPTSPNVSGVLNTVNIDAGWALRFDLLTMQTGTPENLGLIVHYRPR